MKEKKYKLKPHKPQKPARYIEALIEKMVFGGQGMAHVDGVPCFIWNVLPGERVKARVIAKRKGVIEAVAEEIENPSKDRVEPKDDHYLSTAPWAMMTLEAERKFKLEVARDVMKYVSMEHENLNIVHGDEEGGYRNKVEFGFFEDDKGEVHLSFFNRGSRFPRAVEGFSLVSAPIMSFALKTLAWIRSQYISRFDLKTLIVRSNRKGEVIAALFATNPKLEFTELPELKDGLVGFFVYHSTYKSPASVVTGDMVSVGQDFLTEKLLGVELKYGIHSFFQINIPVFEKTLKKIEEYLPDDCDILDFYSGVGSISLPLNKKINSAILVDSNQQAIDFAKENIETNKLKNFLAECAPSEMALEYIVENKILIVDPPRAGLHPDVVKRINEVKPPLVIYLSCNLSTQVRDVKMLADNYEIIDKVIYDYFPRTPHFESLMILKKK